MIDPLAGLDPGTRELAQTRMAAERALYVAQRVPFMLRRQAEILSSQVLDRLETRQMITNATQLADAAVRLTTVAEQLPDRFSLERREIVESLQSEQDNLRELSSEVRGTLSAGSQMASNVSIALMNLDGIVQRLDKSDAGTNAQPFRIGDYTAAAVQVDATAQQLAALLEQLDQTLASTNLNLLAGAIGPAVEEAESRGRDLADHLFQRRLLLLVIGCGLFLVTAGVYRRWVGRASVR